MVKELGKAEEKKLKPWRDALEVKTAELEKLQEQLEQRRQELRKAEAAANTTQDPYELAEQKALVYSLSELIERLARQELTLKREQATAKRDVDWRVSKWQQREGHLHEIDGKIEKLKKHRQELAEKLADDVIFS